MQEKGVSLGICQPNKMNWKNSVLVVYDGME